MNDKNKSVAKIIKYFLIMVYQYDPLFPDIREKMLEILHLVAPTTSISLGTVCDGFPSTRL